MMRMKGTDELRPGYNPQVSSENQFVVEISAGQNAADNACFKEHLERIASRGKKFLPTNYIGDAGYGSCENYDLLKEYTIENYLKYPTYHREKTDKHKNNIFHPDNLIYNKEEDFYTCPSGKHLVFSHLSEKKTSTGYINEIRVYQSEDCLGCPMKKNCTKSKENRKIHINPKLEQHKKEARDNLDSDPGKELRKRRGWEIETFFGDLKYNQGYKRIRLRGLQNAHTELLWLALSYNLRKSCKLLASEA